MSPAPGRPSTAFLSGSVSLSHALAERFIRHGHRAICLGLPNIDLSQKKKYIDMITRVAENQIKAGYKIFVWA
eukprot:6922515-Heterocapsa_arctica.AAC.1